MEELFNLIFHADQYLVEIVSKYDISFYFIIGAIFFCETGLLITPFLPGDSLIFAASAITAMDGCNLSIWILLPVIFFSAFLGDNSNFLIGSIVGKKAYEKSYRLLRRENLLKAKRFYETHGGKTLVFGRYIPVIRTFTPFVAGIAQMKYFRFVGFSIIANFIWVSIYGFTGFFLEI